MELTPIIEFVNADINNGDSLVIGDLNMSVYPGDFVYLTGKVGSGKTSIIRTMTGENSVNAEVAAVGNFDLVSLKRKHIPSLRRELGVVFQDFQLLMDRTVRENLAFVLRSTGWKDKGMISDRISQVLEQVGLEHKEHKMPHQLSGGEQQRVAIARALLNSPRVILADEPTGNLDAETAEGIMQLLRSINSDEENPTTVVMVTHNMDIVNRYPGRVFVCENNICREILKPTE